MDITEVLGVLRETSDSLPNGFFKGVIDDILAGNTGDVDFTKELCRIAKESDTPIDVVARLGHCTIESIFDMLHIK